MHVHGVHGVRMAERDTGGDRLLLRVERRLCNHCNEYLSFKTYKAHKRLYYNYSTDQWISIGKASHSGNACDTDASGTSHEDPPTSFGECITFQESEEDPPMTSYEPYEEGIHNSRCLGG